MRKFISGLQTDDFTVNVDRLSIRTFAESVNLFHPIYHRVEEAKKAGFRDLVAPPTYPITFWKHVTIDWLNDISEPLIHGKQTFYYTAPVTAGEIYVCRIGLNHVSKKKGRNGEMIMLHHGLEAYTDERKVDCRFRAETTLILFTS